jgi:hypothetical protein
VDLNAAVAFDDHDVIARFGQAGGTPNINDFASACDLHEFFLAEMFAQEHFKGAGTGLLENLRVHASSLTVILDFIMQTEKWSGL